MPKSASEYSTALLEGLNEGLIAFDLQRKAVLANGASIRLLGLAGQEVAGRRADELFAGRPELLKILDAGFRGCLYAEPKDLMLQQEDGGMRRLGATTSYLQAEERQGLVLVVQDVSALKQMEWETYQVAKMSALDAWRHPSPTRSGTLWARWTFSCNCWKTTFVQWKTGCGAAFTAGSTSPAWR